MPAEPPSTPVEPDYFADAPPAVDNFPPNSAERPEPSTLSSLIDNMPIKLAEIDASLLEHHHDNWLDNAFDDALQRNGDDLRPLKNAPSLAASLGGKQRQLSDEQNAAAETPAEFTRFIPTEKDDGPIPVLPPNPTEDDLRDFAENHPLVKKAKRIFGASVVSVERSKRT